MYYSQRWINEERIYHNTDISGKEYYKRFWENYKEHIHDGPFSHVWPYEIQKVKKKWKRKFPEQEMDKMENKLFKQLLDELKRTNLFNSQVNRVDIEQLDNIDITQNMINNILNNI